MNGKAVLVVNSSHWMSEIGARLAPDCDFAMIWYYDHEVLGYNCSLRSFHETMDVSEVAKRFGGGGHKKAAGFRLAADVHPDSIFDEESVSESEELSEDTGVDSGDSGTDEGEAAAVPESP